MALNCREEVGWSPCKALKGAVCTGQGTHFKICVKAPYGWCCAWTHHSAPLKELVSESGGGQDHQANSSVAPAEPQADSAGQVAMFLGQKDACRIPELIPQADKF